jgi:hypothetical protein
LSQTTDHPASQTATNGPLREEYRADRVGRYVTGRLKIDTSRLIELDLSWDANRAGQDLLIRNFTGTGISSAGFSLKKNIKVSAALSVISILVCYNSDIEHISLIISEDTHAHRLAG